MAQSSLFGNFLDKFKLSDDKKEERIQSNQIATDRDDGAVEVEDAYSQYLLNIDWSYNSQAELIETYREIANYSTVDYAIEDIVNEMVSFSEHENAIELNLSEVGDDLSENIKKKVYEKYDKIANLLNLNNTIHKRTRQFYIDGRISYQKVIDKDKPKDGLLDIIELDTRYVSKVRNVDYDKDTRTIKNIEEYFVYDDNVKTTRNQSGNERSQLKGTARFKEALRLDPHLLTYITTGITDQSTGMAISWLHKAVTPANQLRMMENALVIYRITRAPERRIFYVDVANLPKSKAEQYVRHLKNMYRNKMSFDPESGTFKDRRHLQTMQEDYWLPRNSNGKGTEVSTLPGGCFAMDTKVSLLDGRELSISDIENEMKDGKTLWTYSVNPKTGKIVPGLISWAGVTQKSAKVMKLTLDNGEEIICTPDHKFPVYGKGFVRADQLDIQESMMPLYRKNADIGKTKKRDYEQYFDNESKQWVYTHRMVADSLRSTEVHNHIFSENETNDFCIRHHIDFNRYNNDPSNLCFMSWNDHQKLHAFYGFSKEAAALGTAAAKQKMLDMKESDPVAYKDYCESISQRNRERWANISDAEYMKTIENMSDSAIRTIANMSEECRNARAETSKTNWKIGADLVKERRLSDSDYNKWFSERQSSGWTDEMRKSRSESTSEFNKLVKWGENREESLKIHKDKQKLEYSHDMLLFIIDQVKGKTTHQMTINNVTDAINNNLDLVEQLQVLNKNKSTPNWKPEYGFTNTIVKKIPTTFGYKNWIEFRKLESIHNHRIVKIEYLEDEIEVGTLTIDQEEKYHDYHTFALSCGIFTKNSNLGDIEDVIYFQKQLYKALNIPISRLEAENSMMGGRGAEISRDELKFSKFVSKIRKRFNMALLDLLKTELILTKVMTIQEWDAIKHKIDFLYAQDMQLEEMRNSEIMRDRLDLLQLHDPYIGKYVSHKYIRETILKQSEQDMTEMDKEIKEEQTNSQYKEPDTGF